MTSSAVCFPARLARLGCAGLAAVALLGTACAQAQTTPPARPPCSLMVKGIDGYVFVPMRNFDPSNKAVALHPIDPADHVDAVICERTSLVPEPTDYRVISEMQLPLAIKAGGATVWLGASEGRLTTQVATGQVSDADQQAIKARVAELQASMDAQKAAAAAAAQQTKAAPAGSAKPDAAASGQAAPAPAKPSGGQAPP
jgi:hypothetical protein